MSARAVLLLVVNLATPAFGDPFPGAGFALGDRREVRVSNDVELRAALNDARAGDEILLASGVYRGGLFVKGPAGREGAPVVVRSADPAAPAVIAGGGGLHFSGATHLVLSDFVVRDSNTNGINIDDAGDANAPARHVTLRRLIVRDVGPTGNRDGIKLSGVVDFRIEECLVERWGSGGSGVDMVGCQRGEILDSTFRHDEGAGDNGVQTKGGSRDIVVRRCRFENAGQRALNVGGSTGANYFRTPSPEFEAKDILVEDCLILGSPAAAAFVGIDGATFRRNTVVRPRRWAFRVLQENREPGFVPSRNGKILENLIVHRSDEMVAPVNVGDAVAVETFAFERNAWHRLDGPAGGAPRSPVPERDPIALPLAPAFVDPDAGDYRLAEPLPGPAAEVGARPHPVTGFPLRPAR